MKTSLLIAALLVGLGRPSLALALQQQAADDPYETLVKEMLGTVEQITKTLQTIRDRPTPNPPGRS